MNNFEYDFSSDWTINKKEADLVINFESNWNIDSGKYYYYRVVGHNNYPQSNLSANAEDNLISCNNKNLLTYVVARNLKEVCNALHDPKMGPDIRFRIISIKKFTTPVGEGQVTNQYEDINFCSCAECSEFCIDFDSSISQECSGNTHANVESNFLNEIESFGFDINYNSNFDISFDLSSDWVIDKKEADIVVDLNAGWSVQSGKYYYYRVVGGSKHFQSNISSNAENNLLSCNNKSLLTYVAARSTKEVCNALLNPKMGPKINFKIISIKKFTNAIGEGQVASQYEEVDFCGCPDCAELCIDFDFANTSRQECTIYDNPIIEMNHLTLNEALSYEHFPSPSSLLSKSGIISIGGSSRLLQYWFPDPNYYNILLITENQFIIASEDDYFFTLEYKVGQIHISGDSLVISPQRTYKGAGLIQIGSSSINFIVSPLIREFKGIINISGESENISPHRTYVATGSIGISSDTEIKFAINLCLIGKINIGGESEFSSYYYLSYKSTGMLLLQAHAEFVLNYYQFLPTGDGFSLGGILSDVVSSYRYYKSQGLINIFGTPNRFGTCAESTGGIIISGDSEVLYVERLPTPTGMIRISGGITDIISPSYTYKSIGDLILSQGSVYTSFQNLGIIESLIHTNTQISQIDWQPSSSITSSNVTISNSTVDVCGCKGINPNLNLIHNINNSGILFEFLKRNKFTLPSSIVLRYKSKSNSWSYNQNYSGLGNDGISQEKWQIIFDIACISTNNYNLNYKFNFYVRRNVNKSNSQQISYISNLTTNIGLDKVCKSNEISTSIVLNTTSNTVYIDNTQNSSVLVDQIGLFKNSYWNNQKDSQRTGMFPEFLINANLGETYSTVPLDYRDAVIV
jgi:hypothetical protein